MTFYELLEKFGIPLIAAFLGALLAFAYQRKLESNRDKRILLQTLMIYRNVGSNDLEFIKALGAVDLVFVNDKKVIIEYHRFLSLTKPPLFANQQYVEVFYTMLYEMGQCSDYNNLSLDSIREFYSPEALNWHYSNRSAKNAPLGNPEEPAP